MATAMQSPMKILYICNEYPPEAHGGVGTYTQGLGEALVARGHEVVVVGLYDSITEATVRVQSGVTVHRHPQPPAGRSAAGHLLEFFQRRLLLTRLVDEICATFQPDIVEAPDHAGLLLRKPTSGHLLVRMHGTHTVFREWMGLTRKRARLTALAEKRILKSADSLVAVSRKIANKTVEVFKLGERPVEVIYNSVDLERFPFTPADDGTNKNILFVGRLHNAKGFDLLIEALKIVFARNTDTTLDVAGRTDSSYAQGLINSVPEEMRSRIRFLGSVANDALSSVYGGAHVCVQPSRVEAFTIVPLESMACGTPVIMSSLVAADEVIDEGSDGFIVDPRDPTALADSILFALDNPERINAMRAAARSKVADNFSLPHLVQKNEAYYQSCIA